MHLLYKYNPALFSESEKFFHSEFSRSSLFIIDCNTYTVFSFHHVTLPSVIALH